MTKNIWKKAIKQFFYKSPNIYFLEVIFKSNLLPKDDKIAKSEVIFADHEFNADFENLISFRLTLQKHNKIDLFLKHDPHQ